LVAVLLRDGEGVGSEAAVNTANGGMERTVLRNRWERERRESRTRYRDSRLLRLLKDPVGRLVNPLLFCAEMGRVKGVKWPSTRRMVGRDAPR